MASIAVGPGFVPTAKQGADLRRVVADLPDEWEILVDRAPTGVLDIRIDRGSESILERAFPLDDVEGATRWLEGLKPSE